MTSSEHPSDDAGRLKKAANNFLDVVTDITASVNTKNCLKATAVAGGTTTFGTGGAGVGAQLGFVCGGPAGAAVGFTAGLTVGALLGAIGGAKAGRMAYDYVQRDTEGPDNGQKEG